MYKRELVTESESIEMFLTCFYIYFTVAILKCKIFMLFSFLYPANVIFLVFLLFSAAIMLLFPSFLTICFQESIPQCLGFNLWGQPSFYMINYRSYKRKCGEW